MFPEFIERLAQEVKGENETHNVTIFTLSTCQWCKRCKNWLNDRGIRYRYVDIDRIEISEKSKILEFLREKFKPERISYPFVVWDDKYVVGYNPNQYEELINLGGN